MNQTQKHVEIGNVTIGNDQPLTVIAGPCQLENLDHALMIGETVLLASMVLGWLALAPL